MTDIRKVKIESILESQIPGFLSSDSPLFKEFLTQYYISQTHSTGTLDFANNLTDYKNISTYASEKLYTSTHTCSLTKEVLSFDDEIQVNSTIGFPDKYGLIQIDEEIITYTGITTNSFTGCIRGFSGVSEINDIQDITGLIFSVTTAEEHTTLSTVRNLNLIFYQKLFEKFKSHYLPDFEDREFNSKIDLELILSRARDFYLTKGTDTSFKILFEILYDDAVTIIKPQEYVIRSSDGQYLVTKNILVEPLIGTFIPSEVIGYTITQDLPSGVTASAAIYNVEYRPTDEFNLYEISLDSESFIYNFNSTKKTIIIEKLSDSLIVDSTVGFSNSGVLYVKIRNFDGTSSISTLYYSGKTINQFLNITEISQELYATIKSGDEIIEDNLLQIVLDDASTVKFRLVNVIGSFDYSNTNTIEVNDKIYLSSFGENFTDNPEYSSWLYNYPTYHEIEPTNSTFITLKDSVRFVIGEAVELLDSTNTSTIVRVKSIISPNEITVDINPPGQTKVKLKKQIIKSDLNSKICTNIQNSYSNESKKSVVIVSSGLPGSSDLSALNPFTYNLVGFGRTFTTTKIDEPTISISHNLLSGNKIFITPNNVGLSTRPYYVRKVSDTEIALYQSTGDLYLSFSNNLNLSSYSNSINITEPSANNIIGVATAVGYEKLNNAFANQLLLKEFNVEVSLYRNKITSSSQIYTIEDAYNAFN
jgi:hypothetical protein